MPHQSVNLINHCKNKQIKGPLKHSCLYEQIAVQNIYGKRKKQKQRELSQQFNKSFFKVQLYKFTALWELVQSGKALSQ